MRTRRATGLVVLGAGAFALAACGGSRKAHQTVTPATSTQASATAFDVGVVGALGVPVPGVRVSFGTLGSLRDQPLIVISAAAAGPRAASAAAAADPGAHFVLVGASTKGVEQPNLVGIVFRDDQAGRLGGILAGLVARDEGGAEPLVGWVGPVDRGVVRAFRQGVHEADAAVSVLVSTSSSAPARCKEAALAAFLKGAVVVMAGRGLCAAAVADAAGEQNRVAVSLGDFDLPDVAVAKVVRAALLGSYSGGEDLVFGFASGAIGVRRLDPRVPIEAAVELRRAAQSLAGGSPIALD